MHADRGLVAGGVREMTWYSYGAQIKEEIHRGKKFGPTLRASEEETGGPVRVEIIVHGTGGAAGKKGRLWRW